MQTSALAPGQLADIMFGAVYLFVGLVAGSFAVVRRGQGMRLFAWLGLWSAMFGTRLMTESPAVVAVLPGWLQRAIPLIGVSIIYMLLPVPALAWLELSRDKLRPFLQTVIAVSSLVGFSGIAVFLWTGSKYRLLILNNILSAVALLVLMAVILIPRLCRKYLVLPNRTVVVIGVLFFALEGLYFNLSRVFHYQTMLLTGSLALGVLLFSLGYVAMQIFLANEHRLRSIEDELAIAREIQSSILPNGSPKRKDLTVASAYRPMTAVAGDFYEFITLEDNRMGVLVADVTGHGVPAALIAAMIKVAMQSVIGCADNPSRVLGELNRILSPQIGAQLVSAAYLVLDPERGAANYSAAGHPPLLRLGRGKLERVESNGLPLGVLPEPEYPVCELRIEQGDRLLLYTDGVVEPENGKGEAFGDRKLAETIHKNCAKPPSEFVEELLGEIQRWRPVALEQQDDITIVVIDVMTHGGAKPDAQAPTNQVSKDGIQGEVRA